MKNNSWKTDQAKNSRGHIDQKYYSPKIGFDECVPVAIHWSKHIHRKQFLRNKLTPFEISMNVF